MIKKILVSAFFAVAFFAVVNSSYSQSMEFCESVSGSGYCNGGSSVFTIGSNGGYLDVLVNIPYDLNCRSVRYEVYRNGDYDNTIYQDASSNWRWFYKEITFYKSG